jgi:hypothetical protein
MNEEARVRHDRDFCTLTSLEQDVLITDARNGTLTHAAWKGMPAKLFFKNRVLHDIVEAYYSHPTAWSEIGFGGPASPRGYVRMGFNRRDPWEPVEAQDDNSGTARRKNRHVR